MKTQKTRLLPTAVLLCTAWQAHAAFTTVDNFNARPLGNIGGQGGWVVTAGDTTSAQVIVDPGNPINKIFRHAGAGDAGIPLPATIPENSTGTYFFRVKRVSATSDTSVGLSDVTATAGGVGTFGNYEVQPNIVNLALRGRDVNATPNVVPNMLTTSWYKVWVIVNNVTGNGTAGLAGDNYRMYVQSDDDATYATQTEFLPTDGVWNFRNGTTTALVTAQFTSNVANTSVYYDDLYIDNTGTNLADPTFVANPDVDNDGLNDAWEVFYFGNTAQTATDGATNGDNDGLTNLEEQTAGTSPINPDTDGDSLNDGAEVHGTSNIFSPGTPTSPIKADTDGDGLTDFQENGSLNTAFGSLATNPNLADSDFDSFPDYAEIVQYKTNPNDSSSVPLLLTLIGTDVRNGSFELLGAAPGAENLAQASHWDTDPDGDVTFWTLWPVESTAATNSGTEAQAPITHGTKHGYLETGNAVYNLTGHIAVEGETLAFSFDHVVGGANPSLRGGLVYNQAGTITRLTTAEVTSTTLGSGRSLIYTVPAGSPAIGKQIGFGLKANTGAFQDVDKVILTVTAADVDHDGLADAWEDQYFGNNDGTATPAELALYSANDQTPDNDTFTNLQEQTAGSDPTNPLSFPGDIDADGLGDAWELSYFPTLSNPNGDPGDDPDGDHDTNSVEYANNNNPVSKFSFFSSTGDSIPDSWKTFYSIPTQTGADDLDEGTGDGLTNTQEFTYNTDPNDKDSDNDGLLDGPEVLTYFTSPLVVDTDGDGLSDGAEVTTYSSSPLLVDTDGDSFNDKYEVDHGTLPNDALSFPTQPVGFTKLEDFQGAGMTVGQTFDGVNGWVAGVSSFGTVANEPVSGGADHVGLLVRAPNTTATFLRKSISADGLQIREGNTGTLFFQIYCSVGALDQSIGLSDVSTGITFTDLEAQFATVGGNLIVRDGLPATVNRDTNFDYTVNQWMNVWVVANNGSDTVKVYVQTPTGQVGQVEITADLTANPFDFRNGAAANTLSTFLIVNNAAENLSAYIDNIYVDPTAANLAVPAGVSKPGLGDGDSLDDAWENTYFGNTSQTDAGDFDNDGTSNLTEFRLGLIPNSGSSRFAVSSTQATAGNFTLTWPSKTGVTFKIERSTSLATGSWSTLQAAYPGTAGTTTYNDATAPTGAAFYKVTLNP
ncbi:MAG: hypothetical protein ABIT37_23435 [Luteolibacter sp.]